MSERIVNDLTEQVNALQAELAACQARGAKLAEASQALVDFPNTPDWVDEYKEEEIKLWNDLRAALTDWRGK